MPGSSGTVRDVASRRLPLSWLVLATVLGLVAAGAVLVAFSGDDPAGSGDGDVDAAYELRPEADVPSSADDVRLAGLEGGEDHRLGDLLGERPVVVNFFASTCQPCVKEMPAFESVHRALGDQVRFVGLAYRDAPEAALSIVESTGVTYETFADADDDAADLFGLIQLPSTVFIDADGKVLDVHPGALDEGQLRDRLEEHFGVAA